MATYWLSARFSPDDTWWYHFFNVVILHTTVLVFFIVRRLLEWAGSGESRRDLLAGFAAALFLLHPAQTEAVAYVAGRSEALSVMLAFAAFAVFLYRPESAVELGNGACRAAALRRGADRQGRHHRAAGTPAPDRFLVEPGFSLGILRRNWRIYVPMALASAAGVAFFWDSFPIPAPPASA